MSSSGSSKSLIILSDEEEDEYYEDLIQQIQRKEEDVRNKGKGKEEPSTTSSSSAAPKPLILPLPLPRPRPLPLPLPVLNGPSKESRDEILALEVRAKDIEDEMSSIDAQISGLQRQKAALRGELEGIVSRSKILKKAPSLNWSQDFQWNDKVNEVLRKTFKIASFRQNQREVINACLANRDCFVIMPTGGGKSLCYQLPAVIGRKVTLVISPLVSLMDDQVMGLVQLGIHARMFTADTSKEDTKQIYADLLNSNLGCVILFVTPEKISKSKMLLNKLEKVYQAGRLDRVVIDEAHCCSQWGHDFRPDYNSLGILKVQFPQTSILALTATATPKVEADVKSILRVEHCESFKSSFNRPNLFYEVVPKPSQQEELIEQIAKLIKDKYHKKSGIIYCFSRKDVESVAQDLKEKGISAYPYHAYLDGSYRQEVHRRWVRNDIQVIVATIAFGLGINKPDVRFVIHHTLSKSLESYYQESGRAGRDGAPSDCIVFYRPNDVQKPSTMVFAEKTGLTNLYQMVTYCEDAHTCRRVLISRYFGEPFNASQCGGKCDNCAQTVKANLIDVTEEVKKLILIMENVENTDNKTTLNQLVDCWRGVGKALPGVKKDQVVSTAYSRDDCERIIIHLLTISVLKESFHHTPYSTISYLKRGPQHKLVLQGKLLVQVSFREAAPKTTPQRSLKRKKSRQGDASGEEDDDAGWEDGGDSDPGDIKKRKEDR